MCVYNVLLEEWAAKRKCYRMERAIKRTRKTNKYWFPFIKLLWPCRICRVVCVCAYNSLKLPCLNQTIKLFSSPFLYLFETRAFIKLVIRSCLTSRSAHPYWSRVEKLFVGEIFGDVSKMKIKDHWAWSVVHNHLLHICIHLAPQSISVAQTTI